MILFYFILLVPLHIVYGNQLRPSYRSSVMEGDKPILRGGEPPQDIDDASTDSDDSEMEIDQSHLTQGQDEHLVNDMSLLIGWLRDTFGYEIAESRRQDSPPVDEELLRSHKNKKNKKKKKKHNKNKRKKNHKKGSRTLHLNSSPENESDSDDNESTTNQDDTPVTEGFDKKTYNVNFNDEMSKAYSNVLGHQFTNDTTGESVISYIKNLISGFVTVGSNDDNDKSGDKSESTTPSAQNDKNSNDDSVTDTSQGFAQFIYDVLTSLGFEAGPNNGTDSEKPLSLKLSLYLKKKEDN